MSTPFPPYSYVPGAGWPHPKSNPNGHSYHIIETKPLPIAPDSYWDSQEYRHAIALFNAGFYWEAHEVWEGLWHAAGRTGTVASFLKALIRIAAAAVKLRECVEAGALTHASRARLLLESLRQETGPDFLGQNLEDLILWCNEIQTGQCRQDQASRSFSVVVVYDRNLKSGPEGAPVEA